MTAADEPSPPLCVDLDGTLVEDDTLVLSVLGVLRRSPLAAIPLAATLLGGGGRAGFKEAVARRFLPDPARLRWRADVLAFLRSERAAGRVLVLVTAAHRRVAERVAAHLGLFSRVLATDSGTNLKGEAKVRAMQAAGIGVWDFVSDSAADLPALSRARRVYLVAPSGALEHSEELRGRVVRVFSRP